MGGSGQLRWTDYQGNWFPFTPGGEPRADRTRSLRVSVYNRAFTLYGFSPQVSLVNEVRTTNVLVPTVNLPFVPIQNFAVLAC